MEQDEEVICTISKDSNINNQYLASQKERKNYSKMIYKVSDSSQKKK